MAWKSPLKYSIMLLYHIIFKFKDLIFFKQVKFAVYITGDTHGCLEWLYDKNFRKLKSGDVLIVCGDFGYIFDGGEAGNRLPCDKTICNRVCGRYA